MDVKELKDKLSQPFDSGRWKEVVECVFPGSQYWAHERVIPSDAEIVEHFTDKGTIRLADGKNLALVELHLKKGAVNLPKNRVKLRSLVAGLIDQERAHGVIAVFEQGGKDYRLSFVAKEAVIEDGEFKTRETPAKRYTYLLGPGETCRTAAERLHALSQKQELKLDDITDAFNVEKLNKQFFKDYQAQYEKFCSFLAAPENGFRKTVFGISAKADEKEAKPIRDFVKRLLGRLVFLQFLQKKGWMGCPADSRHWKNGDKHFLQSFFAGCADPEHFHSAFLTPLFYDALNRENREHDLFDLTGTRIPYLNGGLFEDDLPATKAIDFPPDYFRGLLDCFGAYNFTIDENDPMDAEVGIDPEMLGHIFENLLEDNKDKGAYYTPKAIVHYMCQESLLQYLKTGLNVDESSSVAATGGRGSRSTPATTELEEWLRSPDKTVSDDRNNFVRKNARRIEELLDAVKICDPAIGSGAFPMGLLQEIYRCKLNLDFTLDPAEVKRGIIQNSIYGVDIEKGAVDIARLRFWLSLVVDEETPSPLPNLDYKIMQGNSLLESFEGVELKFEWKRFQMRVVGGDKTVEKNLFGEIVDPQMKMLDVMFTNTGGNLDIEKIERDYFDEHDAQKKEAIRKEVDDFEKNFIRSELDKQEQEVRQQAKRLKARAVGNKLSARDEKQFQTLETELARLKAAKEKLAAIQPGEKPYFLWQLYFMDVFKNGGFDIVIGNPPYVSIERFAGNPIVLQWEAGFKTFARRGDVYCLFYERGINLTKKAGILTYITSNKFLKAGYGENLRKFLGSLSLHKLINFGELPVFEASADPLILSVTNLPKSGHRTMRALFVDNEAKISYLTAVMASEAFAYDLDALDEKSWNISSGGSDLLEKIKKAGIPLSQYFSKRIYSGIKTGLNSAFWLTAKQRADIIKADPKSSEIIKPLIRGKDIRRWQCEKSDLYLIYTHAATKIAEYPGVLGHLQKYRADLEGRASTQQWWELQQAQYNDGVWGKPKILYPDICKSARFAFSEGDAYADMKGFVLECKDFYLLGVLNSSVVWWVLMQTCSPLGDPRNGGRLQLKTQYTSRIPIPAAPPAQQTEIEKLVEKILALKKKNPDADVSALEAEIDQLVYKLYDLTESEIAIVGKVA